MSDGYAARMDRLQAHLLDCQQRGITGPDLLTTWVQAEVGFDAADWVLVSVAVATLVDLKSLPL